MADTKTKETKLKETKSKTTENSKETKSKETKLKAKENAIKEAKEIEANETESIEEESLPVLAQQGNFVYIGKKGAMAYVLAVTTQFEMGADKVIVKARGKSISRAVDVAEIVRNRGVGIKVDGIGIATEEVVTQEGRPLKISSIEIVLKK